jgi:hypothetical protein
MDVFLEGEDLYDPYEDRRRGGMSFGRGQWEGGRRPYGDGRYPDDQRRGARMAQPWRDDREDRGRRDKKEERGRRDRNGRKGEGGNGMTGRHRQNARTGHRGGEGRSTARRERTGRGAP